MADKVTLPPGFVVDDKHPIGTANDAEAGTVGYAAFNSATGQYEVIPSSMRPQTFSERASDLATSFGHGASLGLDVPVGAAIASAATGKPYEEERVRGMSFVDRARQMQPVASRAAEFIGGAAPMLLAPEVAPEASIAAKAGGAAATGAITSGISGAGEAASQGGSGGDILTAGLENAALGGTLGSVLGAGGAVAGKLGQKAVESAANTEDNALIAALAGKGTQNEVRGASVGELIKHANAIKAVTAENPEIAGALKAAGAGDANQLSDALSRVNSKLSELGAAKPANYKAALEAEPLRVGDVVSQGETARAAVPAGQPQVEKSLGSWIDRLKAKWGTEANPAEVPEGTQTANGYDVRDMITQLDKNAEGNPALKAARDDLFKQYAKPGEAVYNPEKELDPLTLRQFVSDVQRPAAHAEYAGGNRSIAAETARDVKEPFEQALNDWLDRAAAKSPDAAKAAEAIRADNKRFSGLIAARNALEDRLATATANNIHAPATIGSVIQNAPRGGSFIPRPSNVVSAGAAVAKHLAERAAVSLITAARSGNLTAQAIQIALKQGVPAAVVTAATQIANANRHRVGAP